MAKTPFKKVTSREIYGADISGLQDAVNKLETVLDMNVANIENHTLFPVEDQSDETLHRRIYEGDIRNWMEDPVPVVKRNGEIVSTEEYVLYAAQGMVVFHVQQPPGLAMTADFSYVHDTSPFTGHVGAGGTAHASATAETAGFMTAGDKLRFDALDYLRYRKRGLYHFGITANALSAYATAANVIDVLPFYVPEPQSFDRLAIHVTTAGTGLARLGIYADNGDIYPGELVIDAGEVDTSTTGTKARIIELTLDTGLYWIARLQSGTPTIRGVQTAAMIALGLDDPINVGLITGYRANFSYADLPNPYPAGAEYITGARPAVFLRRS